MRYIRGSMTKRLFITLFSFFTLSCGFAQNPITDLVILVEDSVYRISEGVLDYRGEPHLLFGYTDENPSAEIRVYPIDDLRESKLELNPTSAYELTDSIIWMGEYYRFRVRFNRLSENDFLSFILKFPEQVQEIKLLPAIQKKPEFPPFDSELFIGEEKTFELSADNPYNIKTSGNWVKDQTIHYKLERDQGKVYVHILPQKTGSHSLSMKLELRKPYIGNSGKIQSEITLEPLSFSIRQARIPFLGLNRSEFLRSDKEATENIEVELDYHPLLRLNKTYRIEPQEEVGGILIAEIFTRSILANGKVLSNLRLYNNHRRSDGYLYVKDGDRIQFISNFDILPKTKIESVEIKRNGKDWQVGNVVHPGEDIEIKLNGISLDKGYFNFEGLSSVIKDSINFNSRELQFSATIPPGINKKRIEIRNNGEPTGKFLQLVEYSKPRNFDFINLIIGPDSMNLLEAPQVSLVENSINDVFITFNRNLIDDEEFHGPQILEIEVTIRDSDSRMIDNRTLRNVRIKPEGSSRTEMYPDTDYLEGYLSLNKYIRNRILNLEPWSTIIVTIRSSPTYYKDKGYERTIELALSKPYTFDIEVSFPAGLITKRANEDDFAALGGISMAMIAQFSFYKPGKINIKKPYQLGAGFLALNAFNFDRDSERDMAIVGLASFYPIRTGKKFAFPLYLGGGYLISIDDWFVLLGPGIRVSF